MGSRKRFGGKLEGKSAGGARHETRMGRAKTLSRLLLFFCLLPVAFAPPATLAAQKKAGVSYVCPMDADVRAAGPGKCPKCGMALEKTGADSSPVAPTAASEGAISLARIPDVLVFDQNGRQLRFYSDLVKDKTVAINFIFTTCMTICPPLSATFRKVQQEMGERVGRDVALISISVDPATDVPERLLEFSAKFKAGPGWTFVTGSKPEIDHLLKSLGAYVGDKVNHTPMVLVGNERAGYWTRAYGLAPASTLAQVISEAADKTASLQVPLPGAPAGERQVERRVTAQGPAPASSSANAARPISDALKAKTPAEAAAAYFPNHVLMTQDNKQVRFFDDLLKGKTVMINFAFTACTGVCPPMTANLAKVQAYLADHVGKEINMITISVDPNADTPAELKKYAEKFKVKPGWYFLTGKKENVDAVLAKLGGYVEDRLKHSSVLLVGNLNTGEWMKMFAMAKPSEIADAVMKIAASDEQK
ncbi:MAG TPA: SCO family protein, partial [Blastocatellia bacterium]|nr:SCO family protein [Blastocatellia bacterium]